jgi:hypothetical protein
MTEIALLLKVLTGANLLTPSIAQIIAAIRSGRDAGKTDEEIEAESMQIALETRQITEEDMSESP